MRTLLFSMLFILSPLLGYAADMAQPSPIADKKEKDKEAFVRKAGHQLELSGSLCEKWEVDPGNARKSICVKKLKVTSSTKTQNITWLTDDFHDYIAYITKENRIALDLLELKKLKISAKIDEKMAFHLFTSYLDIYFKFSKINELIQNHISAQRANPSVKQGNLDQDILREIISVLENPIGRSVQDIQAELEKFEKTTDPSARSDLYIKYFRSMDKDFTGINWVPIPTGWLGHGVYVGFFGTDSKQKAEKQWWMIESNRGEKSCTRASGVVIYKLKYPEALEAV